MSGTDLRSICKQTELFERGATVDAPAHDHTLRNERRLGAQKARRILLGIAFLPCCLGQALPADARPVKPTVKALRVWIIEPAPFSDPFSDLFCFLTSR